ncbi:MAG: IS5 family transposase [Clostridia bacterium]
MKQQTFSDIEYSGRKRKTKREEFLGVTEEIIPWAEWIDLIMPLYPSGKRGCPLRGIEIMLHMFLVQGWVNLSDEGVEDAIFDSYAIRKFVGVDFLSEQAPDATTLLHFRHLLEEHHLGKATFGAIKHLMDETGHIRHGGTTVDAAIINAPSSTKNAQKARDPEMHQTKKGNEWRFGMKVHVGVDAGTGTVVSVEAMSANVHDIEVGHKLFRKDDTVGYGDAGYIGVEKRPEIIHSEHFLNMDSRICRRPGKLRKMKDDGGQNWERFIENRKSSVRSKVEHPFRFVKVQCGFRKTVYRGIEKNLNRLLVRFASSNLYSLAKSGCKLAVDWR